MRKRIQIGINGREWLARQMNKAGVKYLQQDNCFVWIEDYQRAQQLMDGQLKTNWTELLGSWAQQLNPIREQVFGRCPAEYYLTRFQSEWATDVVFREAEYLKRLMRNARVSVLVPHGMLSFSSADVLYCELRRQPINNVHPLQGIGPKKARIQKTCDGGP